VTGRFESARAVPLFVRNQNPSTTPETTTAAICGRMVDHTGYRKVLWYV